MVRKYNIYFLVTVLVLSSCSIRKHLPEGTHLYNGATVKVTKGPGNEMKTRSVRKSLENISFPKKNKMILGHAYKVGLWYAIGEPKKNKGFKHWLRNTLGEPPVLDSKVDLDANAANMKAYLENKGHFESTVSGKALVKGYKMKASYQVMLTRPYMIDSVKWALDSTMVSNDILNMNSKDSYIKTGQQFDLANIKAEAIRTDNYLKTNGYYYFSPDYIKTFVDTTIGDHKTNLFLSIRKDAPALAKLPQTINSIMLFPNYTLLNPPPDTTKRKVLVYDQVYIRDTVHAFRPKALVRPLTYRPGALYDLQKHNESLNRFINMGAFKFVKTRYEPSSDSARPSLLNVYYYLTPRKKKNITAELGAFTKSNSFTGAQVNLNWQNRNLLKGAEKLHIKTYGAIESSANDSLRKNNNWRLGTEVSLTVPRLVLPFKIKENSLFPPNTRFLLGYEWARRQLLFTKNFFRFQYELNWKKESNKSHTLAPVSITYNNATAFSETFLEKINQFPVLQLANQPEILLGSFYNFTYNSKNPRAKNIGYFNANLDFAGNIAGLFKKADSAFDKKIAGAFFAQYAKLDFDFRFTRKLASEVYVANRINVGMGLPYGNSAYLPFSKQFIIGGSSSLRGFRPRQLGPGRARTTADQQVTYPQIGGDYKLELQTELRFPIVSVVKGALFTEAGNIWMKNAILYGTEGKLTKQFLNDLAVDAGFGIRVDVQVLILRLDIGIPLRKPWLPRGQEWVIDEFDFGNASWRKSNLIFNIGIGYPF